MQVLKRRQLLILINNILGLFSFTKAVSFFSEGEKASIVQAIRDQERRTSGEIRVFIESRCRFVDPVDRAMEVFNTLEMEKTEHRNGVIIYIAVKDQQLAVFGDEGIHQKLGIDFWQAEVGKMVKAFNNENFAEGIIHIIGEIGNALYIHFPYDRSDKNELPDDIVFGR
jgi:uncharacterized membrane protein